MATKKQIKELAEKLLAAKNAYYNSDAPIMSDEEYDVLEDSFRKIDPENEILKKVGATVNGNQNDKIKHKHPMLSCDKEVTFQGIQKWLQKIGCELEILLVEAKVDSMSGNCIYENGELTTICSRGSGDEGVILNHLKGFLNIPNTIDIKTRVEVRGEIYLKKDCSIPNPKNKPLRNICVGLVSKKTPNMNELKELRFVSYQVISDNFKTESNKMKWLEKSGFEVVEHKVLKINELEEYYKEYENKLRSEWPYASDGLVVCIDNNGLWDKINSKYEINKFNYYNMAWKPTAESAETILEDVLWQISRSGSLIPVILVKPVTIGGREVKKASLTCYDRFMKMKLEKNDRILIKVAGDVIPYCSANLSKGISQKDL